MRWIPRLLVFALVVTGLSVALASGCRDAVPGADARVSCERERVGPPEPLATASDDAPLPETRREFMLATDVPQPDPSSAARVASRNVIRPARGRPRPAFTAIRD